MTYWHRCKCKPWEESRKGWHRQSRQAPGLQSLRQSIQRKRPRARRSKSETSCCNVAGVQAFLGKLTRSFQVQMPIPAHSSRCRFLPTHEGPITACQAMGLQLSANATNALPGLPALNLASPNLSHSQFSLIPPPCAAAAETPPLSRCTTTTTLSVGLLPGQGIKNEVSLQGHPLDPYPASRTNIC